MFKKYSLYNLKFRNQFLIAIIATPIFLLILLNIVVGLSPIQSENEVKKTIALHTSINFLENLDKNFTERYGDVLTFSQNKLTIEQLKKGGFSKELQNEINHLMQNYPVYDLMMVVDLNGNLIAFNDTDNANNKLNTAFLFNKNFKNFEWFSKAIENKENVWYSDIKLSPNVKKIYNSNGFGIEFSAPVFDNENKIIGVWYNFASWDKIVKNSKNGIIQSLSKTYPGINILLSNSENKIIEGPSTELLFNDLTNDYRSPDDFRFTIHNNKLIDNNNSVIGVATEKGYTLYKGQQWECYTFIPKTKIHLGLFFTPSLLAIDYLVLLITIIIAFIVSTNLSKRIYQLKKVIEKLSIGDIEHIHKEELEISGNDEIKEISIAIHELTENLKSTTNYANEIGKGNFKTIFKPLSENDILGKALINMAENLHQIEAKLKEEKTKAEHASMVKSQFLSTMSHELRTPLNAVIGLTNVLLEENPQPYQIENLNIIRFSANNLLAIISDILDFNKMDAGKIQLEDIPFNLKSHVKNIFLSQLSKAKEKNLELRLNFENTPDNLLIIGDPVRLGQVINNILSNAIKFTEKGYVSMNITVIEQTDEICTMRFAISDTGIGIASENIEHIFDDFSQADASTTRKFGGTGLGLAITKGILALYNSKIDVESTLGKGSTFSFDINLKYNKPTEKRKFGANKTETPILDLSCLAGKKVLLVDDNKINLTVAKKVLSQAELNIETAENGVMALFKFEHENNFDFILMDLQMPEMDGYEATVKIRKKNKTIPIIALTGEAMFDVQQKVMEAGMNDFISKPFTPENLFAKILKYFG